MKNSIFVIKPYKWNGMWVFDDERVGLDGDGEPSNSRLQRTLCRTPAHRPYAHGRWASASWSVSLSGYYGGVVCETVR